METTLIAEQLTLFSRDEGAHADVQLSHELVVLLSEQLYQSPLKAIEELVVNAYDADASECRLFVPVPSTITAAGGALVAIYDNGIGMDRQGLIDLWHIGHSRKRDDDMVKRLKRKSIGKFGIGKLATYSVGRRLTYISKTSAGTLGVTVNFADFDKARGGKPVNVPLPVKRLERWSEFQKSDVFKTVLQGLDLDAKSLKGESWTLAIIEDLKPKAATVKIGNLKWVLSTAMPLDSGFHLYLNKDEIKSSKERAKKIVEFAAGDLAKKRLENLKGATGIEWKLDDDKLVSATFPNGITASVFVTERSLYGKSDDVKRSHGFFVRVRGRLVNLLDANFGVDPKSYEVWNSFRADVNADDLDELLMSSREGIEASKQKEHLEAVLAELFNEARVRVAEVKRNAEDKQKTKREDEREYVGPRLVEEPMADALLQHEPGDEWFYLGVDDTTDTPALIERLYNEPRSTYQFTYDRHGKNEPLFRFDPITSTFAINDDHEFVKEHWDDPRARVLLEDVVTAEVMLEVYLRRAGVRPHAIAEVLTNRDILLRSLSKDRRFSLKAIAAALRDAVADEHDLEVALIFCARALGFVANHISGAGEPDGLGKFVDYPGGEKRIILEAKASASVPSLSAIDFAGLHSHMVKPKYQAQGCLLVAPSYPGKTKEDSEAALRAKNLKISCWTVEQLASVVEHAESRQITARAVLDVVTTCFAPEDVSARIGALLVEPTWKHQDLYQGIVVALRALEGTGPDAVRDVSMVLAVLGMRPEFKGIKKDDVVSAISQLASVSKGGMTYRPETEKIIIHASWDEIERRVAAITGVAGAPRKTGPLRK